MLSWIRNTSAATARAYTRHCLRVPYWQCFPAKKFAKTSDEFYPFFAERNFVYLTGLECKQAVLLAMKDGAETVRERLYILPPDAHAERWTGKRIRPSEAEATSGVRDVRRADAFSADLHALATSGHYERLYLDLYRMDPKDIERLRTAALPLRGGNIPICKSATPASSSAGCGPSNSPAKSPRCGKRKRSRAKASSP